jgi:hypothetical protein
LSPSSPRSAQPCWSPLACEGNNPLFYAYLFSARAGSTPSKKSRGKNPRLQEYPDVPVFPGILSPLNFYMIQVPVSPHGQDNDRGWYRMPGLDQIPYIFIGRLTINPHGKETAGYPGETRLPDL